MVKINFKLLGYAAAIIASFVVTIGFQKNHYNNLVINKENADYLRQEQQLKAQANLQKNMPSFGFSNLSADWAFLKYIQYFGDNEAREETGYSVITDYFETIVKKDPKFIKAHLSLSAANSIFAGNPEATVALLDKSLESLSPDMSGYPFMILGYKAVDEIIFLGDLKEAQKSYTEAAEWAEKRDDKIGRTVAQRYRDTVKFLATNPDPSITQVSGWSMVLKRNNDPKIRKYAMQKIIELGGEVIISADGELTIKPPKKDV